VTPGSKREDWTEHNTATVNHGISNLCRGNDVSDMRPLWPSTLRLARDRPVDCPPAARDGHAFEHFGHQHDGTVT
jgi:hypothetical protein